MIMSSESDSASLYTSITSATSIVDVSDRLAAMQHQATSYQCCSYIDPSGHSRVSCSSPPRRRRRSEDSTPSSRTSTTGHQSITRDCRSKMARWCFQVTDYCKFQRETVSIAMQYLDRFLATSSPRAQRAIHDKKEFQLVAMTCLYIAIKLFEPLAMDAALLAQISHGCYTEKDVTDMEQEILTALEWRVNGPTVHAFVAHLLSLLPSSSYGHDPTTVMTLLDFTNFQADIAVCDYDLALTKPSTVALAAILNSIEGIEKQLLPAQSRFHFFQLVSQVTGMNPLSSEVNYIRARLLKLFSENSGYELPQIANLTPVVGSGAETEECCFMVGQQKIVNKIPQEGMSPVCVAKQFAARQDSFGARCA